MGKTRSITLTNIGLDKIAVTRDRRLLGVIAHQHKQRLCTQTETSFNVTRFPGFIKRLFLKLICFPRLFMSIGKCSIYDSRV